MFTFKKIVGALLMPLPVAALLLAAGVVVLWFTRRKRIGTALCTASLMVLVISSVPAISFSLLRPIEWPDDRMTAPDIAAMSDTIEWVVVLDGGVNEDLDVPLMSRLDRSTLARLAEGIQLQRRMPEARLLLSGARGDGDEPSAAAIMRDAAVALGADSSRIEIEGRSRDTSDQAEHVGAIVGNDRFVLVTSAYHMPRAMYHFQRRGLSPIPLPADHLTTPGRENDLLPNPDGTRAGAIAWREFLGGIWGRLTGD